MKRPQKKWIIVGGALLAVLLIVFSVLSNRESGTAVEVEAVDSRDLTSIVSASGTLEAKQSVSISATTPGEVVRIGVREGQRVAEGDFLLQLDPVIAEAGARGQDGPVTRPGPCGPASPQTGRLGDPPGIRMSEPS